MGSAQDSNTFKQPTEAHLQAARDLPDVHQRNIAHSALDPAVIGAMKSASLCSFLLVDPLLFPYETDGATESDADIERHRSSSCEV